MRFALNLITEPDAQDISRWRYEAPYSVYDGCANAIPHLLNPHFRYHAAHDERGGLVGYFCFGEDARVPAGAGLYADGPLDVGLGMRPDLTGQGLGGGFVEVGLDFALEAYSPESFRMTVAAFNHRATRVYEGLGFTVLAEFGRRVSNGEREWILLTKRL